MYSDIAISVNNISKVYQLYDQPADRLKQMLFRGKRQYFREFTALKEISFELRKGEVLGLVGQNGAGKSTLLQMICGTLTPSSGELKVNGRIAALLELGAGFNPEFTGRENIYLAASVMGLSRQEVNDKLDEIIDFSGIREFIDQPVKTYSSGMYVRLAFSVAISSDPDILVIDEALSVGDGHFARRSFDRIMALKDQGKTILFCSHALYQLETLCSRVIWLNKGQLIEQGAPETVVPAYQAWLDQLTIEQPPAPPESSYEADQNLEEQSTGASNTRILNTRVYADDQAGKVLDVVSEKTSLRIETDFISQYKDQSPGVAIVIHAASGVLVASSGSWNDDFHAELDSDGKGTLCIEYPAIPLLKGVYTLGVILFCEKGIYIHDEVPVAARLEVSQTQAEYGVVTLPHHWKQIRQPDTSVVESES